MPTNVAKRLSYLTRQLEDFDRIVVTIAGQIVADAVLDQAVSDTHGGSMSGIAGGKYRLDVKLTPLSSPAGVRIRPTPKHLGMWAIMESGRRGGYPIAAKRKRGKTSRGRAMHVGGVWRAGPWTGGRAWSGKNTWTHGRDVGFDEALEAVRRKFAEVVK